MYAVIYKEYNYKVISKNDRDYNDYLTSGWSLVFSGRKRECEDYVYEIDEN